MKKLNLLYIILLGIILTNCGNTKNGENSIFTIDNSTFKPFYTTKDVLKVGVLNPNSKSSLQTSIFRHLLIFPYFKF